ncbi:Nucleolar protein 56 [Mycoemilia scoparia]|uniref:Nucleolar protein 56 n=1 Tax=Mycoemilia scoparia TaxID=417184 RepID=A0A9W7ZXU8_9FUNG|nr:Nucleolar protein 56 [Mycoemilia scoparia]
MSVQNILYETASGYALFQVLQAESIGAKLDEVQKSVTDLGKLSKFIKLESFVPFKNAAEALENINDVSEGICSETLKSFIELNLVKSKKSANLGVGERNLAGSIKAATGVPCVTDDLVLELIRGIRLHCDKILAQLKSGDLDKAQLGLGHAYSRAKVKFNVNRSDNMIIQAIALLDQLDKDLNTFAMRAREWYSWHFPELVKIVPNNVEFAKLTTIIRNKGTLTEEKLGAIEEIVNDEAKARQIIEAAKTSMGTDISDIDMINIENFANRVVSLSDYRKKLFDYLQSKMGLVAPNLAALIGDIVGARLIAHAGSLTNLSKYPASTVQILGAEKALFRALKTKGNTPKYGLIYHSSFIGKAGTKNKGRISRFLANKATIASRLDCYSDEPTNKFGEALRKQVEDRLEFYETGAPPSKNVDVMQKVLGDIAGSTEEASKKAAPAQEKADDDAMEVETPKKSKKTKTAENTPSGKTPKSSKKKKSKK